MELVEEINVQQPLGPDENEDYEAEFLGLDEDEGEQLFNFEPKPSTMQPSTNSVSSSKQKTRKPVVPPTCVTPGMSIFDYLSQCNPPLDKKIIDIACSKAHVEPSLRDDAGQEIRFMWMTLKPDAGAYRPGQIASYASRMAVHAALRLRREVGSAVRLPGSAFRKKKDGTTYVTPGVLAHALAWEDLEGWFMSDASESDASAHSIPLADAAALEQVLAVGGPELSEDPASEEEEATRQERLALLEAHKDALSERQFALMEGLINGVSYTELMKSQNIKKATLTRELAIASAIIGPLDFA
jgi:hypothetical protein